MPEYEDGFFPAPCQIAQKLAARYSGLKDSKVLSLTTSDSRKVSHFHKNLKQSPGKKLHELQVRHQPTADLYGAGQGPVLPICVVHCSMDLYVCTVFAGDFECCKVVGGWESLYRQVTSIWRGKNTCREANYYSTLLLELHRKYCRVIL